MTDVEIMLVSLQIPEDLGRRIGADAIALSRAALEGLALERFGRGN